jgi:hypothetical protein
MPTRSLPVESRSRRRPSGAGFRRTATQMALSRCAIAHRGADWYFWRGTPAIACVAAQPPCSWHLPEAGHATGGPCPAFEARRLHRHPVTPVTTTAIRHAQVPAVRPGSASPVDRQQWRAERVILGGLASVNLNAAARGNATRRSRQHPGPGHPNLIAHQAVTPGQCAR